jgi:hypothetical protein
MLPREAKSLNYRPGWDPSTHLLATITRLRFLQGAVLRGPEIASAMSFTVNQLMSCPQSCKPPKLAKLKGGCENPNLQPVGQKHRGNKPGFVTGTETWKGAVLGQSPQPGGVAPSQCQNGLR